MERFLQPFWTYYDLNFLKNSLGSFLLTVFRGVQIGHPYSTISFSFTSLVRIDRSGRRSATFKSDSCLFSNWIPKKLPSTPCANNRVGRYPGNARTRAGTSSSSECVSFEGGSYQRSVRGQYDFARYVRALTFRGFTMSSSLDDASAIDSHLEPLWYGISRINAAGWR